MCGIVGYVGPRLAAPVLLEGLRRLEYRGYDSAGVVVHDGEALRLARAVGKLDNLAQALGDQVFPGNLGIGHTRWATHGRPSELNAHPHRVGKIAVVHNGIIENHLELKAELGAEGVVFSSDTDTEIAAHLIARAYESTQLTHGAAALREAVRRALRRLRGAYGLAIICQDFPDRFVVAKHASPLVIGLGKGENLCASDVPALLSYTRDVLFLEDGEMAELTRDGVSLETTDGTPINRASRRIEWSPVQAEKGGYKHFMLKEIFEQPRAIEDTLRGRIDLEGGDLVPSEFGMTVEMAREVKRVYFIACGTSFHASLAGRHWVEQLARVPAQCELASEVRYRSPVFSPGDLVVAVSQSGETADTLAALKAAREQGAKVLAVSNVLDSAIPRAADGALYTHAGPEIGVASTKAFTTQLVAMLMLAVFLGRSRESLSADAARAVLSALVRVPHEIRRTLTFADEVLAVARKWHGVSHMLYLGRGLGYPIALEGALKLKEISYVHAEGYAAGEMKHGPIALIDENMPTVVVMPQDSHYEKTLSNLQEVRAREGRVIAVATEGDPRAKELADDLLIVPSAPEVILPLLTCIPLQLLAYYVADLKGTDVDQPRNLAKTVTVE
jgi:glucosamine--fructose-6-phosphate aminotransferase (isomerizing)